MEPGMATLALERGVAGDPASHEYCGIALAISSQRIVPMVGVFR
jgi:hypothetical protein